MELHWGQRANLDFLTLIQKLIHKRILDPTQFSFSPISSSEIESNFYWSVKWSHDPVHLEAWRVIVITASSWWVFIDTFFIDNIAPCILWKPRNSDSSSSEW